MLLSLSPQALIEMKITASNNGVWKDIVYIALTTVASDSIFKTFEDQKEHKLFSRSV
jgi:hypothetical protein